MATRKGKDKKQKIVTEALRCIHKYGLIKTNAALITEKLKVPQSLFFYYFPQQDLLYHSLVEYIVMSNRNNVVSLTQTSKAVTPRQHLEVYIKGNIDWAAKHPEQVSVLLYGLLDVSPKSEIRKLVSMALQAGEDRIYGLIVEGMALKIFDLKHGMHPREAAKSIHQSVIGSIIHIHTFKEKDETYIKRMIQQTKSLLDS